MKNSTIDNLIRPHIVKMKPYSSARAEYTGDDGIFLDANENPIGSVCNELHNRYPDPLQQNLKNALASIENLKANHIFIGNGSDECIDVLIRTFCESKEDAVVVCPPVFSMYEHAAHAQNIQVHEVLLTENFQLNIEALLPLISKENNIKIIFICSPNNPTGNLIKENDIEIILNHFKGIVVIDEAYQDFSEKVSWTNRLSEFHNLVVIKTFSKAYGMADARIGMLYADDAIIHYMNTIKMPYNVNQYSQTLALTALHHIDKKNEFVATLNAGRKYIQDELAKTSFIQQVFASDANYVLFKVENANDLYKYLIANKIIVRNRDSAPLLKGCLRVSVGTRAENEKFIEVLRNYIV
ncbi:MAG TPA: histidinol-phosphate transaminase [Chitinophagales bacterium]|nr:histidinol-phosphate transaminase [Chitinophagales bacterium]